MGRLEKLVHTTGVAALGTVGTMTLAFLAYEAGRKFGPVAQEYIGTLGIAAVKYGLTAVAGGFSLVETLVSSRAVWNRYSARTPAL